MSEQPVELDIRPATLSDETLLQIATVDREKYTSESVSGVVKELRRRGVTEVEADQALGFQRRSLHDFLAGTVVIRKEAPASRLTGPAPATATSA